MLSRADEARRTELANQVSSCERVLKIVDSVLTKYDALEEVKRSGKKLLQKIGFGNGEMQDLADIRLKLSTHTSAIMMTLNLISIGSQGKVETQLSRQEATCKESESQSTGLPPKSRRLLIIR
jgi:hypothetical protein